MKRAIPGLNIRSNQKSRTVAPMNETNGATSLDDGLLPFLNQLPPAALAFAAALASAAIFLESARLGVRFLAAALAASIDSGVERYFAISDSSKTDCDELSSHPISTSANAGAAQNILNFLNIVELWIEKVGE